MNGCSRYGHRTPCSGTPARAVHLTAGETKAAIADFVRGGEPPATTEFAYAYAAALLLAGDQDGYARYVSRQAELHGEAKAPFTLYVLTRMAMLADRSPVSPHIILEWASRAVNAGTASRLVRSCAGSGRLPCG